MQEQLSHSITKYGLGGQTDYNAYKKTLRSRARKAEQQLDAAQPISDLLAGEISKNIERVLDAKYALKELPFWTFSISLEDICAEIELIESNKAVAALDKSRMLFNIDNYINMVLINNINDQLFERKLKNTSSNYIRDIFKMHWDKKEPLNIVKWPKTKAAQDKQIGKSTEREKVIELSNETDVFLNNQNFPESKDLPHVTDLLTKDQAKFRKTILNDLYNCIELFDKPESKRAKQILLYPLICILFPKESTQPSFTDKDKLDFINRCKSQIVSKIIGR